MEFCSFEHQLLKKQYITATSTATTAADYNLEIFLRWRT